jgi:hypothetical protein
MLIAFTDGISDAFPIDEIPGVVRRNPGARATDVVALLMDAGGDGAAAADDRTVVVVRNTAGEPSWSSRAGDRFLSPVA